MDKIRLDGTPSKIKGKYIPSLHCSSSFEGASLIFFYNAVIRSFSSHCFTSVLTSADVIFHNFLELQSAYLKEDFFVNVPFINRFTPPLAPSPSLYPFKWPKSTTHDMFVLPTGLKLSCLACTTGFYSPKHKAKGGPHGTKF